MIRSHRSIAAFVISFALLSAISYADVTLPSLISDHAVFQKSPATTIWGWCLAGESIAIKLDSATATTIGDATGHWKTTLDLTKLGPGPFQLEVQGKNKLIVQDVLVGDVWLSSGQSNMQFTLNATTGGWDEIARSANPAFRWFFAKPLPKFMEPQEDIPGVWFVAGPDHAGDCSGVAYYFGKKLQADLKTPIGLVLTAVGGTTIQSWMSAESLDQDPQLKAMKDKDLALVHAPPAPTPAPDPNAPPKKKRKRDGPDAAVISTWFYNQLIHPLAPFTMRGVIWYQGEAHYNQGDFYRKTFPIMIRDWRKLFGQATLPFYYCQLPNTDQKTPDPNNEGWIAGLRAAQDSGLNEPQTGEAVLIDAGTEDMHPPTKDIVGQRLALLAEAGTYNLPVKAGSPRLDSMAVVADKIEVHFKDCPDGLVTHDLPPDVAKNSPDSPVQGFAICGDDHQWAWATATIDNDKVTVSSPKVPHPVAVRYAWSNNPTCNLFSKDGWPAAPFESSATP
jgi:sialate O-acetylesterase